ncbi:MAG: hypothetical protein GY940_00240 [bacterium]|nr:hypothetical protein [bacterium]
MKLNKVIIHGISGLFLLSLVFFLASTVYSSIDSAVAGSLKDNLSEYEKKADQAAKAEASRTQWRNIQTIMGDFKTKYLMNMDQFSQFRTGLRNIFRKNRLQHLPRKKVRYIYKNLFKDITQVGVSFSLTGAYANFKTFIHEMTTQAYKDKMVVFRSIKLSKRKQGDIIGEFAMEVYLAR